MERRKALEDLYATKRCRKNEVGRGRGRKERRKEISEIHKDSEGEKIHSVIMSVRGMSNKDKRESNT